MVTGLAVAIVVAVAAVGAAVFVYRRRRKTRGFAGEDEKDLDFSDNPIASAEACQEVLHYASAHQRIMIHMYSESRV